MGRMHSYSIITVMLFQTFGEIDTRGVKDRRRSRQPLFVLTK